MIRFLGPAILFLLQQPLDTTFCPESPSPSGILNLVTAVSIPLTTLGCVPELASQPLGTVLQAPTNKFLWCIFNFFLQFLANRSFFLDFIYCIHLLQNEKQGRVCCPISYFLPFCFPFR